MAAAGFDAMEKMENVLRRFHLIKEPRESDARQQLKRELFAFNKVPPNVIHFSIQGTSSHWRVQREVLGEVKPPIESSELFLNCVFAKYTVQALLLYSLNPIFSSCKR